MCVVDDPATNNAAMTTPNRLDDRMRGVTLLELLIVCALIIAIMGIGFPSIMRMNARRQLKGAVQNLQAELYRTRLEAMRSGKAVVFRYRYDSSVYEILPKEIFDAREKNREGLGAFAVGPELLQEDTPSQPGGAMADDFRYQKFLPLDLAFDRKTPKPRQPEQDRFRSQPDSSDFEPFDSVVSPELLTGHSPGEEKFNGDDFSPDPLTGSAQDDGWSQPIVFFPNGRTSSASFSVRTTRRYDFRQEITLRGLTGTARVDGP